MKKWFALLMCLYLLFPLSACDRIEKTAASRGTNQSSNPLRIACIINGTLGDSSLFDSAHEGMKRLKDELRNAIDIDLIEMSYDDSIWESVFLDAAASNYDLLIVGTEQMGRLLEQYADHIRRKPSFCSTPPSSGTRAIFPTSTAWNSISMKGPTWPACWLLP